MTNQIYFCETHKSNAPVMQPHSPADWIWTVSDYYLNGYLVQFLTIH